ncbi:hypothetical protein BV25DRAFT_1834119 [Artomyces pyxidatus]|uniref:Uncharacterized protein n=1 Tax=Artomyces pyxidatus TaxID=48021 RepID=A0ACB8TKX9_9AGAM|nr:hypothetical protein BV25DRAFT_1834119 [Artomyces pyxidatus]
MITRLAHTSSSRVRSGLSFKKAAAIHNAWQYARLRQKDKVVVTNSPHTYVYVGNLGHTIRQPDLYRLFKACGSIERIDIRCGRGYVMAGPDSRFNATILFRDAYAVATALKLNAAMLKGYKLVVSTSPLGLPELAEIARASKAPPPRQPLPLRAQPTLVIDPYNPDAGTSTWSWSRTAKQYSLPCKGRRRNKLWGWLMPFNLFG